MKKTQKFLYLALFLIFIGGSIISYAQSGNGNGNGNGNGRNRSSGEVIVVEKFRSVPGEGDDNSFDFGWQSSTTTPINNAKKDESILLAAEFNRLLDVLINSDVPVGQGCGSDDSYFIAGYDPDGGVLCRNNKAEARGVGANENFRSVLRDDLQKNELDLDIFPSETLPTKQLLAGKQAESILSAGEFNRVLKVLEGNLKLLGRECPTGQALKSINLDGSFNCGKFSVPAITLQEFGQNELAKEKFKKIKQEFNYFISPAVIAAEELAIAEEELLLAQNDLSQGEDELALAESVLSAAEAALVLAEEILVQAEDALVQTEEDLAQAEIELSIAETDLSIAEAELATAESNLSAAQAELTTAESNLSAAQAELTTAESNLSAAQAELVAAEAALASAELDLTTAEADLSPSEFAAVEDDLLLAVANATALRNAKVSDIASLTNIRNTKSNSVTSLTSVRNNKAGTVTSLTTIRNTKANNVSDLTAIRNTKNSNVANLTTQKSLNITAIEDRTIERDEQIIEVDELTIERDENIDNVEQLTEVFNGSTNELAEAAAVVAEVGPVLPGEEILPGESDNIKRGKVAGDDLTSLEFNRVMELLIISENMIDSSCDPGFVMTGFDDEGVIKCAHALPVYEGECSNDNYVDVQSLEAYSCSGNDTCYRTIITRVYGLVENRKVENFTCSGNETCSRMVVEYLPAEDLCGPELCIENCDN